MINKVDAAQARLAAAQAASRRAGATTGLLAAATLWMVASFISNGDEMWPAVLAICSMIGWIGAAKRYEKAAHRIARAKASLIRAEEAQDMKLERRLEW